MSNTIKLPKNEYIQVQEDGRTVTYCTLRQQALHVIGLDYKNPYTRHGKKFYRPYRNIWGGENKNFDKLVDAGLMEVAQSEQNGERYWYRFTRAGLDWLGEQIGVKIYEDR